MLGQAQEWSFAGGTLYFNNTQTQWNHSRMLLVIGNDTYSSVYPMDAAEEANMWVATLPTEWSGASYLAVINTPIDICAGYWNSSALAYATHYSAAYTGGLQSEDGKEYLLTPQSGENGCTILLTEIIEEVPEAEWYLKGSFNDWSDANQFVSKEGGEEGILYTTVENLSAKALYQFKIYSDGNWYGNGGTMSKDNHTGWTFGSDNNQNCQITTGAAGAYEFAWDTANHSLSVTYPAEPLPAFQWFVKGDFNNWEGDAFDVKENGEANTLYATINLPAGKEYVFKIQGNGTWYGNGGMIHQANHTNWVFDSDANCAFITTIAGEYEFVFDTLSHTLTVNYPYNPKQATLYASPVRDANPDVMLQAFYWAHVGNTAQDYTAFGDVRWSALNTEASELASYFDLVWLAPSQETADYTGYLPINYSNQGQVSSNTEGHSPWGSAQDLRSLIDNLHQGGAKVIADIVLNHSSASHPDEYSGSNYNWCHWNTFDFGRYGQFNPDYTWICKGDEMFYGKKNVFGNECGNSDNTDNQEDEWQYSYKGGIGNWTESEFNCMYSRDWAHKKKEVREMSRAYLTWMRDSIGYDGFRYDFMKGIHGSHLYDYNCATAPYLSVAELFDGDIDKQLGFLQDAHYQTYVFDFPGKFTIYNSAIREYNLKNLKGNQYTMIFGNNKKYAVTFCDNHDSFHEDGKSLYGTANTIDDRQARQALAYLLSMPGVPCVVYPYWNNYKNECKAFINARRAVGVNSESTVVADWTGTGVEGDNYYTAMIEGTNGYLFLKLGYDCVPTDAPSVAAPEGMRWQCAWANRDHAGVWYTVPNDQPTNINNTKTTESAKKVLRNGVMYIQHGDNEFTVKGEKSK